MTLTAMITATLVYARNTSMEHGLLDSDRRKWRCSERNLKLMPPCPPQFPHMHWRGIETRSHRLETG